MRIRLKIYIFLLVCCSAFLGASNFSNIYNLASKSLFDKLVEENNPYNSEEFVSRKYGALNSVYRLEADILARRGEQKLLLIGVGRGYAALEIALKHPNVKITAINKEHNLFDSRLIYDHFKQTYTMVAIMDAFSRIDLKVMDIEKENLPPSSAYDMIVFETKVIMYLKDKLNTIEKLFNNHLENNGAFYFDGTYLYDEPKDNNNPDAKISRIIGVPPKDLFLDLQLEVFNKGHKFINFIRNDYVLDPTFKMVKYGDEKVRFPYQLNISLTDIETAYHKKHRSHIVDPRYAPFLSIYTKAERMVAFSA